MLKFLKLNRLETLLIFLLGIGTTFLVRPHLNSPYSDTGAIILLGILLVFVQGFVWLLVTRTFKLLYNYMLRNVGEELLTQVLFFILLGIVAVGAAGLFTSYVWLPPPFPAWINNRDLASIGLRFEMVLILISMLPWLLTLNLPNFKLVDRLEL